MKKVLSAAVLLALLQLVNSCEINEEFQGSLTTDQVGGSGSSNTSSLLDGVYTAMRSPFQGAGQVFALSEVTTDERLMPTRGGDWDDNGKWRQLHLHTWDANHIEIRNSFNNLNAVVFAATDLLRYNPTQQQQAEARFLRAWATYWILDLFDQVPYRDPGESVTQLARVRKGTEALEYVISEVNEVLPNLPDAPAYRANKDAARGLLMKCYLNRGVYANRAAPTFAAADMNQVITLADQIINTNRYKFAANYFDNFAPDNTNIGTENIFTELNQGGVSSGAQFDLWRFISHYNMVPSGYNGPTALSDFYDKFGANDIRRGTVYSYTNGPLNPGKRQNVGFLVGQQYNLNTDAPLTDRSGAPLAFTREVSIIETDAKTLERTGIRPMKYPPDFTNNSAGTTDNDMVHLRLPDVLLMKAEAILRGGTATSAGPYGNTPLALVNSIRAHPSRNAGALPSLTLDILLDERGRELYLEEWRRQDMIRFGKFLGPIQEGPTSSSPTYLIFPIPNQQVAVNSNLTQNPGY
ncbi:RagB/SusD family nutrient uptake outer membrane protein [Hymenobacter sp. GOD-10R]|uniref:RagB/SusD family nutrient uptake outer membrane protein n=1 Tax=Hymenobacter sp. GOD-10R TaxID=3093922 RepID=UPI002D77D0C5|nr:RagB/SusD family nutrient uptake outer membrane protein [Hymenobacter sp. GOD-10R]WRQ30726.1 RagB/SusD family nutrient uptake outer membrane protein [Hymenobacter sp. GOD-10R]